MVELLFFFFKLLAKMSLLEIFCVHPHFPCSLISMTFEGVAFVGAVNGEDESNRSDPSEDNRESARFKWAAM